MESCKTLKDYAIYVDKVRKYRKTMDLADAIDHAAEECIEEGVMTEFLHRNRKKVKELSILEYTAEQAIAYSWEDGCEEGERRKLKEQVRKKLAKGKTLSEIADDLEEEESVILNLIDEISSN